MKKQQTEYGKFLQKRHSKFHTDQPLIDQAVCKATNSSISDQTKIVGGEASEVYRVITSDNDVVFVRIMHGRKYPLLREKWATDECRRIGIPVPETLYLKQLSTNKPILTISVTEEVPGISLRFLQDICLKIELENYLLQAGEILAKIHTINTHGFGRLNEKGEGLLKSFRERILEPTNEIGQLEEASKLAGISQSLLENVLHSYKKHVNDTYSETPKLVHNDFGLDHIFINKGKISGIIDFGDCEGADPVLDLVRWDYFSKPNLTAILLIKGYENISPILERYKKNYSTYMQYLCLQFLLYYYWDNNKAGLNHAKKKIEELD